MTTKPRALNKGDTIGIAAPASPFDRAKFMKGIHALEKLGFRAFYQDDIFDQNRYLAGTDRRRAEELSELIRRRDIAAIMFARGGYGSQRIIPLLDAKALSLHPKPVIGFSDLTALLSFLRQSCRIPTFYGPVITQLGAAKGEATGLALIRALTAKEPLGNMPMGGVKVIKPGQSEGPLVGGCLSLINSSIGTPYELNAEGSVLFIEEIGEKVYVLDRMLTQLKNSGVIGRARGIVFGSIVPLPDEPHDVGQMIHDVLADFTGPVVAGFPAGHTDDFVTLPMGAAVKLTATEAGVPEFCYTTGLLF
ncbi:MAG: LD-carboxypeptidase [Pseudomonadota bacterium]